LLLTRPGDESAFQSLTRSSSTAVCYHSSARHIERFPRLIVTTSEGDDMICRLWRGWTRPENADAYETYLRTELYPRLERELSEHGYRGHLVLRRALDDEVEFVTLTWFDSLHSVRGFAGDNYETAVITDTAARLLDHYQPRAAHFEVSNGDGGGVTLRRAVAVDAAAIGDVFDAAVKAGWSYLGDLAAEPMFTSGDWDELVAAHEPPNLLLVAVDDNGIVGYVAAHPDDCEMFLLFVHPAHAGRGIGRQLLAAADDALRTTGCRDAFLFVHELNARAISVYEAAGYHPDGTDRISDFRGTAIRELRLSKRL